MLNLTVIAVGRLNAAYYKQAAAEYEKRLSAFCKVHVIELAEEAIAEKNASPAVIEKALEKEGKAILAAVPKGAVLTALCVEGRQLSSEALAHRLSEWAVSGVSCAAFAIGSSHGLSPQVKQPPPCAFHERNDLSASVARVMLLEHVPRLLHPCARYHK
ncbi:MAG: 23S rRNA (pseudouridine(1915)-N(3))-methyltransferase RlmH [Ruthenibacterium sp.]